MTCDPFLLSYYYYTILLSLYYVFGFVLHIANCQLEAERMIYLVTLIMRCRKRNFYFLMRSSRTRAKWNPCSTLWYKITALSLSVNRLRCRTNGCELECEQTKVSVKMSQFECLGQFECEQTNAPVKRSTSSNIAEYNFVVRIVDGKQIFCNTIQHSSRSFNIT